MAEIKFKNDKILDNGEISKTGFYSIVKNNGWTLRITLFKELAYLLGDDSSRYISECKITKITPLNKYGTKNNENQPLSLESTLTTI